MSLFQESVLKNYLKRQDHNEVGKAYKKYVKYFHNPTIQQNIKDSKEEQFQEGFLRELFVNIFGYILRPNPEFNLTTEFKNEKGAKKADGAIVTRGHASLTYKALAVIELKGTKTKDLESIRQQAFDYKANQSGCVYVITSNFEKLRFYINNAVDFEEFNLFTLNQQQFDLMYLCLHKDNLLNNLPLKINNDSLVEEEKITKKFYADYSLFKRELYRDLVKQNTKNEIFREELNKEDSEQANKNIKLILFKKSQKLIDRFLFIFFAEDRGLLPPNSTLKILEQWDKLKELDEIVPLYKRYIKYFNYLDIGRKGTDKQAEIFAYNGGLFKPDPVLDSLLIDDELLYKHTKTLSIYDFESQVDVNILGHIFENSLNEIENINAEISASRGHAPLTSKRKKDGVFYTPKYITKYIVDNTVGKLCSKKKTELNIIEEEYFKSRKGRPVKTLKALQEKLETYRKWMLTLTILDPACGSGAFLNQALDFLIKEHTYIDELQANLLGGSIVFRNIENTILENNIYGVDINEESVEIAKLSLWLRTAQPRRQLNVLNNNIKCGNSLIDDKAVAGDKAFNWQEEFPQIFNAQQTEKKVQKEAEEKQDYLDLIETNAKLAQKKAEQSAELSKQAIEYSKKVYEYTQKQKSLVQEAETLYGMDKGGFDVIIGNPPYGIFINEIEELHFKKHFPLTNYKINLYILFIERMFQIFDTSIIHFIIPKSLLFNTHFENIRRHLLENSKVHEIFMLSEKVFEDAEVGGSLILKFEINTKANNKEKVRLISADTYFDFEKNKCVINDVEQSFFLSVPHCEISPIVKGGGGILKKLHKFNPVKEYYKLKNGLNPGNIKHILISDKKETDKHKPIIWGKEFTNYITKWGGQYVNYNSSLANLLTLDDIKSKEGMKKQTRIDFALRTPELFENIKLLVRKTGDRFVVSKDIENLYFDTLVHGIYQIDDKFDLDFLLAVLNSKPATSFYRLLHDIKGKVFAKISLDKLGSFPLPEGNQKDRNKLSELAVVMSKFKYQISLKSEKFVRYLQSQFKIEKPTKKLQNWHQLEFSDFIKELNKAIKKAGGNKLSKLDEMEWMEVFEVKKGEAQKLKAEIDKTDKEIDQMVYELYGLNEEEIRIVEGSIKQ